MQRMYEFNKSIEIEADADFAYRFMYDFDGYPSWSPWVKTIKVVKRREDGLPLRVQCFLDINIAGVVTKTGMELLTDYEYDHEHRRLSFKLLKSPAGESEGYYQFRELNSGNTLGHFSVKTALGLPIPVKLVNFVAERLMFGYLQMIKAGMESMVKQPPVP